MDQKLAKINKATPMNPTAVYPIHKSSYRLIHIANRHGIDMPFEASGTHFGCKETGKPDLGDLSKNILERICLQHYTIIVKFLPENSQKQLH
jgi:hypothetical protein